MFLLSHVPERLHRIGLVQSTAGCRFRTTTTRRDARATMGYPGIPPSRSRFVSIGLAYVVCFHIFMGLVMILEPRMPRPGTHLFRGRRDRIGLIRGRHRLADVGVPATPTIQVEGKILGSDLSNLRCLGSATRRVRRCTTVESAIARTIAGADRRGPVDAENWNGCTRDQARQSSHSEIQDERWGEAIQALHR